MNHMVRIVTLFCLPQTRNTQILFSVHKLEFAQGELSKLLIDKLAETPESRHCLLKVAHGRAGAQFLTNGIGVDDPINSYRAADQLQVLIVDESLPNSNVLIAQTRVAPTLSRPAPAVPHLGAFIN